MATPRPAGLNRQALGRLGVSILIAVGLWSWVTLSRDPETTREVFGVAIEVVDLAPDLIVVGDVPTVTASYTGTRSNTQALVQAVARASVDMSRMTEPGSYAVDVHVDEPPDIWSSRADPRRIDVQIERRVSIVFPVIPTVLSDLGVNQQVGTVKPSASEVVVSGPESSVDQVRAVQLPVDIANRTSNFVGVFTPVAVDNGGQAIGGVTLNPTAISAEVQITARGRQLAVVTQITGAPASGFEIVDRAINPITVLVDGPAETIEGLITVSTLAVDVSGARGDVTQRVRLVDLPPGVSILEPSSGFVDVVIQIRQRGVQQSLPEQLVVVLNVGVDLEAEVTPGAVVVNVEASEQQLLELEPGSLQVVVDARGLGPGTYALQPSVVVPATVEWLNVVPETVTVTLRGSTPIATPGTPVASPSSEPIPYPVPGLGAPLGEAVGRSGMSMLWVRRIASATSRIDLRASMLVLRMRWKASDSLRP